MTDQLPDHLATAAADPSTSVEHLAKFAREERLAPLVVCNPTTASVTLDTLALSKDEAVLRAVTRHPNTSIDTLQRLANQFPEELLANPMVPLLLLEQPDFLRPIGSDALKSWVRHPDTPIGLLALLTQHVVDRLVAAEARMHVSLCGEVDLPQAMELEPEIWRHHPGFFDSGVYNLLVLNAVEPWLMTPLLVHGERYTREAVAKAPRVPKSLLDILRRAGASDDMLGYGRPSLNLDEAILELLADGSTWSRSLAARHPAASSGLLARLAKDASVEVRHHVAGNCATPVTVLATLANDRASHVRQQVAHNPMTSAAILGVLAGDHHRTVRLMVSYNAVTTTDILTRLALDMCWRVRRAVAKHPHTPVEILENLTHDPHTLVRYAVARNPRLPLAVIEGMVSSDDPVLKRILAKHPNTSLCIRKHIHKSMDDQQFKLLKSRHQLQKEQIAALNRVIPERTSLPANSSFKVRRMYAESPQTAPELLTALASDTNTVIRTQVALNTSTPKKTVLHILRHDSDWEIRWAAHFNKALTLTDIRALIAETSCDLFMPVSRLLHQPDAPSELLEEYLGYHMFWNALLNNPNTTPSMQNDILQRALDRVSFCGEALAASIVLAYPQPPAEWRMEYVIHKSAWIERCALACNPYTPADFREHLKQDVNCFVRAMARAVQPAESE